MAEGRSNAAIAEAFVVSERAVEKHVTSIFGKLGLAAAAADHRRVLAVLAYLRALAAYLAGGPLRPAADRMQHPLVDEDVPAATDHGSR